MVQEIPLAKPFLGEAELEELRKTFQSGWIAQGPRVKRFEEMVAGYSGAKQGVAINSCSSGLYLSLLALEISKGDKVIIPDFTFWSTGNVVLRAGAEPVVVDIDPETLCMDMAQVEDKLEADSILPARGDIKAIIPVHVFGHPAEIDELNRLAKRYEVKVIEDAASGLGSELKGRRIGSLENPTVFSFQGRKITSTGEGGMIVLDDTHLALQLRLEVKMRSFRMSDIQAAVGLIQIGRMEIFVKHRIKLAALYHDLITDAKLNIQLPTAKNCRHTYQAYVVILLDETHKGYIYRDNIVKQLRNRKIESTIGTYSLTSDPRFNGDCPAGQFAYDHSLALPMYHTLTTSEVHYIVDSLKAVLK